MKFSVIKFTLVLFSTLTGALYCGTATAQREKADSLDRLIEKPMHDTVRVQLYDEIGRNLMYSKPLVAIKYLKQGISLAERIKYPKGLTRTKNRLGSVYRIIGSYAKSLESHFEALNIARENEDLDGSARALNNIGILYSEQHNSRKAIDYFKQTQTIATQLNNANLLEIALTNMGTDYAMLGMLDSAQYYTQEAYDLALKKKDTSTNTLLINLGNIHFRKKEYLLSLSFYRQSIPVSKAAVDNRNLSLTYFEMARVFQEMGQRDSSFLYAEKSLSLAREVDNPGTMYDAAMLLSDLYEPVNLAQSYAYYKEAMVAKDRVFNEEKMNQIHNLGFSEELRAQQRETERVRYENRVQTFSLLGGIGVFMAIAFLLYLNTRNRRKANTILQKQKDELEETLSELKTTQIQLIQAEKMASLGELTAGIAHEIQNPLNFVNNLSEVNMELIEELEEEIDKGNLEEMKALTLDMHQNQKRVVTHGKNAEAIVRGMLQHSHRASSVRESTDINAITTENLRVAYQAMKAKEQSEHITLETKFDAGLPRLDVIPGDVGKAIHNLVSNAVYAVNKKKEQGIEGYEPIISVTTGIKENSVEIIVCDNGIGMPVNMLQKIFQPFFTTKPAGQGTGLGLSLAYDIITQGHGGKLSVESVEGEGSVFTIMLPLTTRVAQPA